MAKGKLTKRAVDALVCPPGKARAAPFDAELAGFHVEALASGRKVYRFKWARDGRQGRETIGEHGPITCEEARARAEALRGKLREGLDPQCARQDREAERRRGLTVGELVERWLVEGRDAAPAKRQSSWETDARKLRRHILPLLGSIPARQLTRSDIERAQRQIANGETACDVKTGFRGRSIVTGGRGAARGAVMSLSACLGWAVDQEILAANAAARVKKLPQGKCERFLSDAEAARLLYVLEVMQAEHALHDSFADMIRLLLLTGARKREIQFLEWKEVDLRRGSISLPPIRSKTGAKHIPLAAPAAAILAKRAESARPGGLFVFPSPLNPEKPADGLQKAWQRVRARADLPEVRLHDLRHSFASFAAASGASLLLIGKVLGQSQAATTQRYAHLGADPVRDLVERVGAHIMRAGKNDAEVISEPAAEADLTRRWGFS